MCGKVARDNIMFTIVLDHFNDSTNQWRSVAKISAYEYTGYRFTNRNMRARRAAILKILEILWISWCPLRHATKYQANFAACKFFFSVVEVLSIFFHFIN